MNALSVTRRYLALLVFALSIVLMSVQRVSSRVPDVPGTATSPSTSTPLPETTPCRPGSGWTWTKGPSKPEVAEQVRQTLGQMGIEALVEAISYGETDSCGTFSMFGIDFTITVQSKDLVSEADQQELADRIRPILTKFGKPNPGNARVTFLPGNAVLNIRPPMPIPASTTVGQSLFSEVWEYVESRTSDYQVLLPLIMRLQESFNRKVYVVVYDPLLKNGQNLSTHLGWFDHAALTQGTIDLFRQASDNRLSYSVAYTSIITDGWPVKADGFTYTEEEYLAVISGQSPPHSPDGVDYNAIVNSPLLDICGKANRGEIDEVWIYNGPYFGFWESTLVGPGAYWYNSPPVSEPYDCNRLIPIMGPSQERNLDAATHNFGHRTEAIMTKVYGSWQQNRTSHSWERFALVKALSPDYSYSGCGNVHYPPNGTSGYDYSNASAVLSNCDDFADYPNLGDPAGTAESVTCSDWNCTHVGYLTYWFEHLPYNNGCGPDAVASDWWKYFVDPALPLDPSSPCRSSFYK